MVFKRRERRSIGEIVGRSLYPRGGWVRAFEYVGHRVRRLPDTPEKISRGIWAGVFAAFTPFYGLHFVIAAVTAKLMRGNILASLMATFFGFPPTYIPIAIASLGTGYWMLGLPFNAATFGFGKDIPADFCGIGCRFADAFADITHNIKAIFTHERADWLGLQSFYEEVFFPYMIGSIIPGVIAATVCYMIAVPVIRGHQNRRRKVLRAKLGQLNKKTPQAGDDGA